MIWNATIWVFLKGNGSRRNKIASAKMRVSHRQAERRLECNLWRHLFAYERWCFRLTGSARKGELSCGNGSVSTRKVLRRISRKEAWWPQWRYLFAYRGWYSRWTRSARKGGHLKAPGIISPWIWAMTVLRQEKEPKGGLNATYEDTCSLTRDGVSGWQGAPVKTGYQLPKISRKQEKRPGVKL